MNRSKHSGLKVLKILRGGRNRHRREPRNCSGYTETAARADTRVIDHRHMVLGFWYHQGSTLIGFHDVVHYSAAGGSGPGKRPTKVPRGNAILSLVCGFYEASIPLQINVWPCISIRQDQHNAPDEWRVGVTGKMRDAPSMSRQGSTFHKAGKQGGISKCPMTTTIVLMKRPYQTISQRNEWT